MKDTVNVKAITKRVKHRPKLKKKISINNKKMLNITDSTCVSGNSPLKSDAKDELSKSKRKRLKKLANKKAVECKKSVKSIPEQPLPPSMVLPLDSDIDRYKDENVLINEIKQRLIDHNERTVRIMPVPKNCPPGVLKDLCPSALLVRFPNPTIHRYAFYEFRTSSEAKKAVTQLSGRLLNGKPITVHQCSEHTATTTPNGKSRRTIAERTIDDFDLKCVYVSGLSRSTVRTDMAQLFRTASKVDFPTLKDGTSKGYCMLMFKSEAHALHAFATRNGTMFRGIPLHVNFKLMKTKKIKDVTMVESVEIQKTRKRKISISDNEEGPSAKRVRTSESQTNSIIDGSVGKSHLKKKGIKNKDVLIEDKNTTVNIKSAQLKVNSKKYKIKKPQSKVNYIC